MVGSLTDTLAGDPVLLLFVVVAAGSLAGRVRVAGFSLGAAAVLFAGIAFGAIDDRFVVPEELWILGLALFVYTVGVASGPGFLGALRRRGLAANALVVAGIVAASLVAVAGHSLLGLPSARAAGTFTGAETNTPALAAAIERLKQESGFEALAAEPVVGYSLAYPVGVLLPLFTVWLVLRRRRLEDDPAPALVVRTAVVDRPVGTLGDVSSRHASSVTFGRLRHEEHLEAAAATLAPAAGDLVSIVGPAEEVDAVVAELGHRAPDEIQLDRHELDFRRIVLSSRRIAGRRLGELELDAFEASATRVRRGDVDMVAHPDLPLELGDRVRIVAPPSRMKDVAVYFGDSYRALAEVDWLTLGLGLAAGLALGSIAIPVPGAASFSLGSAGGPLLVGLALGAVGRTGPLVWQPPYTAGLTLRQLGLVLFFAGIGLRAGPAFSSAIAKPSALLVIATGIAATSTALAVVYFGGTRLLHLPSRTLLGVVAGLQTQPAVLAYAASELDDDRELTLGYASVYPLAMIAKIVIAQALVALLL